MVGHPWPGYRGVLFTSVWKYSRHAHASTHTRASIRSRVHRLLSRVVSLPSCKLPPQTLSLFLFRSFCLPPLHSFPLFSLYYTYTLLLSFFSLLTRPYSLYVCTLGPSSFLFAYRHSVAELVSLEFVSQKTLTWDESGIFLVDFFIQSSTPSVSSSIFKCSRLMGFEGQHVSDDVIRKVCGC